MYCVVFFVLAGTFLCAMLLFTARYVRLALLSSSIVTHFDFSDCMKFSVLLSLFSRSFKGSWY